MRPLEALSAKLSAVRERQDAAFARHGGVVYDAAARSADASRSLADLAVKARALGAFPGSSLATLSPAERALLASILTDARRLEEPPILGMSPPDAWPDSIVVNAR
jgi:hypothetical protein